MKKITSITVIFMFVLSFFATCATAEEMPPLSPDALKNDAAATADESGLRFTDVPKTHPAYDAVRKLSDMGILEGYRDGSYKGDTIATRYEMAWAMARLVDLIENKSELLSRGAKGDVSLKSYGDLEKATNELQSEIKRINEDLSKEKKKGKTLLYITIGACITAVAGIFLP